MLLEFEWNFNKLVGTGRWFIFENGYDFVNVIDVLEANR